MSNAKWMRMFVLSGVFFALTYHPESSAQTLPSTCKAAGGTQDCTGYIYGPWQFINASCGSILTKQTAAESLAVWEGQYKASYTACPGHIYETFGWVPRSSPMYSAPWSVACGGYPNTFPTVASDGNELANWYLVQVGGVYNPPYCNLTRAPYYAAQVRRTRVRSCPRGYMPTSAHCSRTSLDVGKNLGPQCPTCGNPIVPGIGNKFQKESDYLGAGDFPLRFERYYNSLLRRHDRDTGYYGDAGHFDRFGNVGMSRLASTHGRPGKQLATSADDLSDTDYWTNLAPESIGAAWRHTYQRSIWLVSANSPGVTTAYAFRHDGRVLSFVAMGGNYFSQTDVNDKLVGVAGGWQYTSASGDEIEFYNSSGRLVSISDRAGRTHSLSYDEDGRLTTVADQFGSALTFSYELPAGDDNALSRIHSVTTPGGNTIVYTYDSDSLLTSATYPDARSRGYQYGAPPFSRALTSIVGEDGNAFATFSYDSNGLAISSQHAGGAGYISVTYSSRASEAQGGNATITDSAGVARTYTYTNIHGSARIASISQPSATGPGLVTQTTAYDVNGNVRRKKAFNGDSTCFLFDLARNLETVRVEGFASAVASCPADLSAYTPTVGTRERKVVTAWHASYRLPTSITELNRTTSFTHDASGNVLTRTVTDTSVIPNVSRSWTYTYNPFGQVLTEDGPRTDISDVTTYAYYTCTTGYHCGQLHTVTNALGHTTTYNSYNAHAQPTQLTDANGLVTSLAYDLRQRLTDRCVGDTLPGCTSGELTHLDYWPTGLLKKVTNPDGSYIAYGYDAAHRLTGIQDGALNRIEFTLDAMGNRTAESTYDPSNALRRTHSRVYNTLNQLWKDVNAGGAAAVTTTFGYDNNGNQTSTAAPLGRNSSSLYDELNRLKRISDPASGITQFGYDANDNLTSVTDPRSLVTSYTYNGFGDLKTQTSPDTGLTTNTYDSGGNLDTSTDSRGAVTDYTYDALDRVTSASFTLGGVTDQTITYGYDAGANQNGLLTSAGDAQHDLAWTYDTQGRVTGKGQTVGGVTLAMGYGYNSAGQLGQMLLPSGAAITYGYNANGHVTSLTLNGVTTILNNITYDPFGPITGWSWGNGTTASRDFDADGKVTQVDNASGASLKNYGYDDAFRITSVTDAGNTALSWSYGYDNLDRLNSATSSSMTQGWTYDANGNRLTQTGTTPSAYVNSATSNRVNSISGSLARTYGYDAAGNTLSYAGATFTYNHRGRMSTASNAGITAAYTYNALGQRIRRATSAATTLYVYDEAGHLAGKYTATGALIQETVWLGDMPIATLRPDGSGGVILYYVHADHLNTPRLVTDSGNHIRWRWESDAFGTAAPDENPQGLGVFEYNLRFPGQQYDGVVGLHYNYFRDYDPAIGRYGTSDPIGIAGGLNTYSYASQSPSYTTDPRGLDRGFGGASSLQRVAQAAYSQYHYRKVHPYPRMAPPRGGIGLYGQFSLQGSAHLILAGVSISRGAAFTFRGRWCTATTICGRLGPGAYIGGGATWAIGGYQNGITDLDGWSFGAGADLGMVKSVGGQVTGGPGDVGVSSGLGRAGVGWGMSGGVDFCYTKLDCLDQCPTP